MFRNKTVTSLAVQCNIRKAFPVVSRLRSTGRALLISTFVIMTLLISCAHIPKESVMLSEELTQMILSARTSHLALLDQYMTERRQQVDTFIQNQWTPLFMSDFVSRSGILPKIENTPGDVDKGQLMLQFSEAAVTQISEHRIIYMSALDEIKSLLRAKIEDHYHDMLTVNQALTAHLRSASNVETARKELLAQVRVAPEELLPLDKIEGIVNTIIKAEAKAEEIQDAVEKVKNTLKGD